MVLSARQQYGDFLANPANKRARSEPSSSDSPAYAVGKGVAKITADWAGPKLGAVIVDQHKRAAQLRKSMQSNKEAIAKLQELSAQEKTPSSLTVKLAPAAQKMLPHLPAAAELIKQTEKAFIAEALRQREAGDIQDQADLSSITSGDQFDIDARAATHFDGLQPVEQALVEALIAETKEELLLTMRFSQIDVEEREEKQRQAKAKRASDTQARAMEMDQLPTGAAIKGVVAEIVAAQLAKEMAKLRKHANSDSRRKVHFEGGQQSRSDSRGRGRSHSTDRGQPRTKHRGRPNGGFRTPRRGPSRGSSQPRGRSATPKPRRRQPSSSHSKSRENSRGGRGTRPHRSPSAKHGGRERSVGGRGSKTGARR